MRPRSRIDGGVNILPGGLLKQPDDFADPRGISVLE
jgi:hypothetical protein